MIFDIQFFFNGYLFIIIDFFERRFDYATGKRIYWPTKEVVQKIQALGCHVVPKPSKKTLSSFQRGKHINVNMNF